MNTEGLMLLRLLIFKMWSLNEARENGDCKAMADEINSWLPPSTKISGNDVFMALGGNSNPQLRLNAKLLRSKIDKMPHLFSARLNGDYQAILNEVLTDPELRAASLADVIEAMAIVRVPKPEQVRSGSVALVGSSRLG